MEYSLKNNIIVLIFAIILLLPEIKIFSPIEKGLMDLYGIEDIESYEIGLLDLETQKTIHTQVSYKLDNENIPSVIIKAIRIFSRTGLKLSQLKIIMLIMVFLGLFFFSGRMKRHIHLIVSSPIFIITLINRPFFSFFTDLPAFFYCIGILLIINNKIQYKKLTLFITTITVIAINHQNFIYIMLLFFFAMNKLLYQDHDLYSRNLKRIIMGLFTISALFYGPYLLSIGFLEIIYRTFLSIRYNIYFFLILPVLLINFCKLRLKSSLNFAILSALFILSISHGHHQIHNICPSFIISKSFIFFPLLIYLTVNYLSSILGDKGKISRFLLYYNLIMTLSITIHYYGQLRVLPAFIQQGFDEYWLMVFQQFLNLTAS